jgi:hypothetical protein
MNDLESQIKEAEDKLKELRKKQPPKVVKTPKPKKKKLTTEEKLDIRLKRKLVRVISKMGLRWAAWSSIIDIRDDIYGIPVPTAMWYYNEYTKKEHIAISRRLMKEMQVSLIIKTIKHEMLHKAMYRGIRNVSNEELANAALDSAINKILTIADPTTMFKFGNFLFPPGEDDEVPEHRRDWQTCLNPAIRTFERDEMNDKIKDIFDPIYFCPNPEAQWEYYGQGKTVKDKKRGKQIDNKHVPDPLTLYLKMAASLPAKEKGKIKEYYAAIKASSDARKKDEEADQDGQGNGDGDGTKPAGIHIRGGKQGKRANDKMTMKIEKQIADMVRSDLTRGGGHSDYTNIDAIFNKFIYQRQEAETESIQDFINRMETMKQVEGVVHNIHAEISPKATIDPYASALTRTGFEFVVLGFSGANCPIFFNHDVERKGKKKVAFYFDTSPSMHEFIPYMLHIADYFAECDDCEMAGGTFKGRYAFSETVKGMNEKQFDEFIKGKVRGGCGTSFNCVCKHALERIDEDDVDLIVVMTDGYSSISDAMVERFNQSGKRCHTIYFVNPHESFMRGHDRYGQETSMEMTSDLDKLNGHSYTIVCKPPKN